MLSVLTKSRKYPIYMKLLAKWRWGSLERVAPAFSFLLRERTNFLQAPNMVRNPRFHCQGRWQSLVNAREIVKPKMKRSGDKSRRARLEARPRRNWRMF